jgi:hypothetical protein
MSLSKQVLKNMQEQMDVLELRVAAECKEAFTELQVSMSKNSFFPSSSLTLLKNKPNICRERVKPTLVERPTCKYKESLN